MRALVRGQGLVHLMLHAVTMLATWKAWLLGPGAVLVTHSDGQPRPVKKTHLTSAGLWAQIRLPLLL